MQKLDRINRIYRIRVEEPGTAGCSAWGVVGAMMGLRLNPVNPVNPV
jgi:hypothetical protein